MLPSRMPLSPTGAPSRVAVSDGVASETEGEATSCAATEATRFDPYPVAVGPTATTTTSSSTSSSLEAMSEAPSSEKPPGSLFLTPMTMPVSPSAVGCGPSRPTYPTSQSVMSNFDEPVPGSESLTNVVVQVVEVDAMPMDMPSMAHIDIASTSDINPGNVAGLGGLAEFAARATSVQSGISITTASLSSHHHTSGGSDGSAAQSPDVFIHDPAVGDIVEDHELDITPGGPFIHQLHYGQHSDGPDLSSWATGAQDDGTLDLGSEKDEENDDNDPLGGAILAGYADALNVVDEVEVSVGHPSSKRPKLQCKHCRKTFQRKRHLQVHEDSHSGTKRYPCNICGSLFGDPAHVHHHKRNVHKTERKFACDECGKTFKQGGQLSRHKKVHNRKYPFTCDTCHKTYTTKHNLSMHQRLHNDDLNFKCSDCGEKFSRQLHLDNHMHRHTGERPHVCELCGAKFTQASGLSRHRKSLHVDGRVRGRPRQRRTQGERDSDRVATGVKDAPTNAESKAAMSGLAGALPLPQAGILSTMPSYAASHDIKDKDINEFRAALTATETYVQQHQASTFEAIAKQAFLTTSSPKRTPPTKSLPKQTSTISLPKRTLPTISPPKQTGDKKRKPLVKSPRVVRDRQTFQHVCCCDRRFRRPQDLTRHQVSCYISLSNPSSGTT